MGSVADGKTVAVIAGMEFEARGKDVAGTQFCVFIGTVKVFRRFHRGRIIVPSSLVAVRSELLTGGQSRINRDLGDLDGMAHPALRRSCKDWKRAGGEWQLRGHDCERFRKKNGVILVRSQEGHLLSKIGSWMVFLRGTLL
jgi:hypothetical protein